MLWQFAQQGCSWPFLYCSEVPSPLMFNGWSLKHKLSSTQMTKKGQWDFSTAKAREPVLSSKDAQLEARTWCYKDWAERCFLLWVQFLHLLKENTLFITSVSAAPLRKFQVLKGRCNQIHLRLPAQKDRQECLLIFVRDLSGCFGTC